MSLSKPTHLSLIVYNLKVFHNQRIFTVVLTIIYRKSAITTFTGFEKVIDLKNIVRKKKIRVKTLIDFRRMKAISEECLGILR